MRTLSILGFFSLSIFASACSLESEDRYREPLPQTGDVALAFPGASGGGTGVRTLEGTGANQGPESQIRSDARFYSFTRDITDAIDVSTTIILGMVWTVAQTTPTKVDGNEAIWGPGQGSALSPVVYRLVVRDVGGDSYDYSLEGRPKASSSDGDFVKILTGHGYGKGHAQHDSGWFHIDNDAFRKLDPARGEDTGTVKVNYDVREFPKTIGVEIRPSADSEGIVDAKVEHLAGGAGHLTVTGRGDVEDDGEEDQNFEDVAVESRWNASGAGRADVKVSGGSLPIASVDVVECWSSSFALSYYANSANEEEAKGAVSACPSF